MHRHWLHVFHYIESWENRPLSHVTVKALALYTIWTLHDFSTCREKQGPVRESSFRLDMGDISDWTVLAKLVDEARVLETLAMLPP